MRKYIGKYIYEVPDELLANIKKKATKPDRLKYMEELAERGIEVTECVRVEDGSRSSEVTSSRVVKGIRARSLMRYWEQRGDYMADHKCRVCEVVLPTKNSRRRKCKDCS